jgi:signal transduction histidine kinase
MQPLARLRLRLTLWYAGVFTLVLLLLGAGLFLAIRHQVSAQLDGSLRAAAQALEQAARIREAERDSARGAVVDAVDELHIPDRSLYLFDGAGRPIKPAQAPEWIRTAVRQAVESGKAYRDVEAPNDRELRLYAERFSGTHGTPYVAAALADRVELEDVYASLVEAFAAAALAALLLVSAGSYVLVRKSTAPIERSMQQMRRFMADAAHELRTPITILRTRAEIAGDLLTLARAAAGEWPVARERLYLDDAAAAAVDTVEALARSKGVTLAVGAFEEAPIIGDPALVRQLLLAVLDNAIKYTPSGGHVRLDVSAQNGAAVVAVTDTGVGIPTDALPLVFERFYRAEPARRQVEGAGLGLAIARWIAQVHGARIDVSSTLGQGTGVTIKFPLGH